MFGHNARVKMLGQAGNWLHPLELRHCFFVLALSFHTPEMKI